MRPDPRRSILDGIPVEDKAFPLHQNKGSLAPAAVGRLSVVGNCPCGAPIYGPKEIPPGTSPDLHRTCACRTVVVNPLSMETK